jgi:tetratricopeptide (TPR) repeat protein
MIRLHRYDEAIEVSDDIVRLFGSSPDPDLPAPVAQAFLLKGMALYALMRREEAIEAYENVIRTGSGSKDPDLTRRVPLALLFKARALNGLHREKEALKAARTLVRKFGKSREPGVRAMVAQAIVVQGSSFRSTGRPRQAIKVYGVALARSDDRIDRSGWIRTQALNGEAHAFCDLGMYEKAMAVYDSVAMRYGDSAELEPETAEALAQKGFCLVKLSRYEAAMAVLDSVGIRYGSSLNPDVQGEVAIALVYKSSALAGSRRLLEAKETCDAVIDKCGDNQGHKFQVARERALSNRQRFLRTLHAN